jgi:putative ABC transport system permease protein
MPEVPFSVRLYRRLVNLYPAGFRENYAGALERQFLDEIADSHGPLPLAGLWIRMLCDLAVSVPSQFAREVAQDARNGLRLWKRRPIHTGLAIAALAIGIGASTGVFSVVNALLLRSLPFRDPDRLMATHIFSPPHASAKEFHDWRRQSAYLDDAAILSHGDVNLGTAGEPARVHLSETSWNFFSLLGTQPISGRGFTVQEDTPGNDGVAIIGYGLWQRIFGGSPTALGSTIRANGTPLTIIGIAPPGFDYPSGTLVWTPTAFDQSRIPSSGFLSDTIARLKPGLTWAQAREAFAAEADRLSPNRRRVDKVKYPPTMIRLQDALAGPVKQASLLLMAGVVLILLIACTNVANLLMARTADRATELSIRSALGASRARLSQQLLTESVLMSVAASAAGLFVARWTTSIAAKVQPAPLALQAYAILDVRVLSFCVAVSLLSGLLFGLLPALYAGRTHTFGTRGSSAAPASRSVREVLIAAQIALTVILLASSVSIGRAFLNLMHAERGFDTRSLVTVNVSLDGTTHQAGDRQLSYFQEAIARVRNLPGVRAASATDFLPLYATAFRGGPFSMDGRPAREFSMVVSVLPQYFETMGGRILYGREFNDAEVRSDAQVALVSETFAREFGEPADAIGHELRIGTRTRRKIIGVVRGMDYMADANSMQVFYPAHSPGGFFATIVARVDGSAEDRLAMVRDAIRSVDPQVPVFGVKTMEQRLDEALVRPQFYSTAVLCFAGFALLLAVIGIYGVVSYAVAQRTHELGIRMALGTTSGRLRSVLLRQGLIPVAAGAVPGVAGAALSGRLLENLIAGAKSIDIYTCVFAVLLLAAIAALSIYAATRRIARLDIAEVLRAD